jgi:TFIIF-interacting CTD phosphatase-like protein
MDCRVDYSELPELLDSSSDSIEVAPNDPWHCDPFILTCRSKIHVFLDLDLTLIVSGPMSQGTPQFFVRCQGRDLPVSIRPGLDVFLARLSLFATWYVYTAGQEDYAAQIMDKIDPAHQCQRVFTRRDCERLGPLQFRKRWEDTGVAFLEGVTFIVDDIPSNFGAYGEHGVRILPFRGNSQDQELYRVLKELYYRSGGR